MLGHGLQPIRVIIADDYTRKANFSDLDGDWDGDISHGDMVELAFLQKLKSKKPFKHLSQRIINGFDADNDGVIDCREERLKRALIWARHQQKRCSG